MESKKPFMNICVAMDETNAIGRDGEIPWGPLPTDFRWYITHSTTTEDPLKRVALILGRLTLEDVLKMDEKYTSRWHMIVITSQSPASFYNRHSSMDVVKSFDEATHTARRLLDKPSAMIESIFLFGGVRIYEEALAAKVVKRIYLTRIFAKVPNCDARLSNFDLTDFRRIKRSREEMLAELDDQIIEENGWKYQFQVYEWNDL